MSRAMRVKFQTASDLQVPGGFFLSLKRNRPGAFAPGRHLLKLVQGGGLPQLGNRP
jgi:hypothetical protein